ncbi:MAG: DMT family transporter [Oscillospiraceae bacterium]|nr:DMT family transporter [Oscillospiraceae bacterium]
MTLKSKNLSAMLYALAAALFYALNVPCSKLLLENISPTFMAAFLYIGAGIGVGTMYLFHRPKENPAERLERKDMPFTVGMVVLDIAAPILLMIGVNISTSANASLLGNFEIVATTVIALVIFKEKVSGKLWTAIGLITLSSIILSFGGSDSFSFSVGSLFVLGATVCWGFENNCTRSISEKSTHQIVTIKGFFSGMGSLIVAFAVGEKFPPVQYILFAMLLGFVAYGLSIFTYIRAQKTLGAAKTSAFYSIAPFMGVFLSFVLLRETLTLSYIAALLIMIAGTAFAVLDTLSQRHAHKHTHTFRHTHNGETHTHTVTHYHEHIHFSNESKHSHKHNMAELEKLISQI